MKKILVNVDKGMNQDSQPDSKQKGKSILDYWPLIALLLVSTLAAFALTFGVKGSYNNWMHYFMGFFLCQFALLKLFSPKSFADGFQMYDILAKKSRIYAYFYPLIELLLGVAYFSFFVPIFTNIATILIMSFGAVGVFKALKNGLDIYCPCMGSILEVPLSTVTLVEDLGMAIMAFIMLFT